MVFADVWSAFTVHTAAGTWLVPGLISNDTHHPTADGYQRMAQVYRDAVRRVLTRGR
jgi:hypothetical protein